MVSLIMWAAALGPILLIPPRITGWRPGWLGAILSFLAAVPMSGASALLVAYLMIDVTGLMPVGRAIAGAIGKWAFATILCFVICTILAFARR